MGQLLAATERGFCNLSLRRVIPPLHSAFEKVLGNHRSLPCLLEKEDMCEAVENGIDYFWN